MNWNAKPESALLPPPPPYPQGHLTLLQQYLSQPTTVSQGSFSSSGSKQEACMPPSGMHPSGSNPVSQPVPNIRNYKILPQFPVSNMHNRTFLTLQRSGERVTCVSSNGPRQPNHILKVSSGVTQNVWLNSPMRNPMPSHTEASVCQQTDFGTNVPNVHPRQCQLVTSDSCSVELQMNPADSLRVPVTFQGNQGLNQSLSNGQVDWAQQYTFNELTYPDYRPQSKQYSDLPQSFPQDPPIQKANILPSPILYNKNSQLPIPAQPLLPTQTASVSYQCVLPMNKRPPPLLPYNCEYGNQPLQNTQHVIKHSSVEVSQSPEMHPSAIRKDFYNGFQQHWQSTNEKTHTVGKFCEIKVNTSFAQPLNEPVRSNVHGVQTLPQNNQDKRVNSCDPSSNQTLDPNVAKENLVRDFKSLMKIKKKFSELARKIRISKDLLQSAGCSKTMNISYSEPAQPSQFPTKGTAAKSDSHCSVELLNTCLSLWKKPPSQRTEEKALKSSEEKQCNDIRTNPTTVGISKSVEVQENNPCLFEANYQSKKVKPSQETALSVLMQNNAQNNDSNSSTNVTKGTELQVAVVSPLILSNVNTLSVKGIKPPALPETCGYPMIKEGSIFSLQSQLAENTTVTAALKSDVSGEVANNTTSTGVPLAEKEKQSEPGSSHSLHTPVSQGAHVLKDQQTACTLEDSAIVSSHTLQIENICSLVEGDVSYNSQIAEIFNSELLRKVEAPELSQPGQPVTGEEKEKTDCVTENKDIGFQKDKCVQCTNVPQDVTGQSEGPEAAGSASIECIETKRGVVEDSTSGLTTEKENKASTSPEAVQENPSPQETDLPCNANAQDTGRNEAPEDDTPILHLHDQLSELVKEFPYGIEPAKTHELSSKLKTTGQISEDQTTGKSNQDSKDSTDSTNQIQITILSSEQMRELFPEQDEPCVEDTQRPCDAGKLTESQKEKPVTEVESQCDPQAPTGQECSEIKVLDSEKDTVHCCALGWLSLIYEGVPQCQCDSSKNSTSEEEKEEDQTSPLQTNSCKQRERSSVIELNSVSDTIKTPVAQMAEKSHVAEKHGCSIKETPKTKQNSSLRAEQKLSDQVLSKYNSSDKKDASKSKQDSSLKTGDKSQNLYSPKCDESGAVQSNKMKGKLKFHNVSFHSSDKMTVLCEQSSKVRLQKKNVPQNSHLLKAKTEDLQRRNGSFVRSLSPEQKKSKFKVDGSQKKHLDKRKLDQGNLVDMEIKKKKYDKQQNKNVGGAFKLYNTLSNPSERANHKIKVVSDSKSSDLKGSSSKFIRVKTSKEYLQRQKHKEMIGSKGAPKIGSKEVLSNSESIRPSKHSLQAQNSGNYKERQGSSEEASKEPVDTLTSCSKNLKLHQPESKTYNISKNGKGKEDGLPPDKTWMERSKVDTKLAKKNSEVDFRHMPPHAKEQTKSYLNRVGFKCTERESICLTAFNSSSEKLKHKEKSVENKPKTSFSVKDGTEKLPMLEFKLCPDVMLQKAQAVQGGNEHCVKEQAPMQVSGIKSRKEDWLKCAPMKRKRHETSNESVGNSRLCKRSASADGLEKIENPVKDSKAMFQTYKQMYLEKRSQSLGSSPVK